MAELLVSTRLEEFAVPPGDPGWFGPGSIAWQVHADLGSMLVGGMAALLLQTLHPLVVQGVADHSTYRDDPFGRLQRTAEFIAATTYGGDELASALVRRVRSVHALVRGTTPDYRQYRAQDPELLGYVHVTEVWCFLAAYQRYAGHPLLTAEKNRYLAEMSVVAERLGAGEVPVTTREVREYFRAVRPDLARSHAARETIGYLLKSPIAGTFLERSAYTTICEAAIDLLPGWARARLGLRRPTAVRIALVRPSAAVLATALRFVVGGSPILEVAQRRAAS